MNRFFGMSSLHSNVHKFNRMGSWRLHCRYQFLVASHTEFAKIPGQVWLGSHLSSGLVQMCFSFNSPLPADPLLEPYVLMVSDVFMQNSWPLVPSSLLKRSLILFICTASMSMPRFEIESSPRVYWRKLLFSSTLPNALWQFLTL